MEITDYQKLPGAGLRRVGFITLAASRCRLYLGQDHLLSVDSTYGSETYKRFYFRDIQTFLVRKTPWGTVSAAVFGGLAALCALLLFSTDPVTVAFGSVFTTLFVCFFLGVTIRILIWGGTCQTWVQTAVHTEELPSLNRVRTCRQVLGRLLPLIQASQPVAPVAKPDTGTLPVNAEATEPLTEPPANA